jgi:GNAT superfamily N-acetyltransferase
MLNSYTVIRSPSSPETFCYLRHLAGLSPRPLEAVRRALPASCYAIHILHQEEVVGMGRIVGDGVLNFEIVDIAVAPAHQGKGIGRLIMEDLMSWLSIHAVRGSYVSLIADVPELYSKFGFKSVGPKSEGMALTW